MWIVSPGCCCSVAGSFRSCGWCRPALVRFRFEVGEPLFCLGNAEGEGSLIPEARRLGIGKGPAQTPEPQKRRVEGLAHPNRGPGIAAVDGLLVIEARDRNPAGAEIGVALRQREPRGSGQRFRLRRGRRNRAWRRCRRRRSCRGRGDHGNPRFGGRRRRHAPRQAWRGWAQRGPRMREQNEAGGEQADRRSDPYDRDRSQEDQIPELASGSSPQRSILRERPVGGRVTLRHGAQKSARPSPQAPGGHPCRY